MGRHALTNTMQTPPTSTPKRSLNPLVLIAGIILVVIAGVFILEFVVSSTISSDSSTPEAISEDTYADRVSALLENADAANGDALLTQYQCVACHRLAAEVVAPRFVNMAEIAAERRPPMSAAAYIYESITRPSEYVVEGYADTMPQDFGTRISDDELGDIIAYLLSSDAH